MAKTFEVETEEARRAKAADDARRLAGKWINELNLSEKAQAKFLTKARKIQKLYRKQDSETEKNRKYAMLWSNTSTILPAIYARPPQPVVTRRFRDADPVGRSASEVLERGLAYSVDKQDIDGTLRTCAHDFALVGRAVAWERYVPTHGTEVVPKIPVLQITTEAGTEYEGPEGERYGQDDVVGEEGAFYIEGEAYKPVVFEESVTDYVNLEDFGTSPSRTWGEVTYVWRRVYMGREELIDRFGEEIGKATPLDWGPKDKPKSTEQDGLTKKAAVYEIWDKCSRKVFWVSKSYANSVLDQRDDPLGLDGFFPCPRPLFGTSTTDALNPTPDYVYYQDQAEEIDVLTARISELQEQLKVRGFYAGDGKKDLNAMLAASNTTLIPVADWISLKEDGGLRGKIEWFPIDMIVGAIKACIELRRQLIEDVYQITGVADILRGASDPNETYGAQAIKAQWGALRVREKQNELARFARDIMRIKAEVMAEHFSIDTFKAMTGLKLATNEEKAAIQAQLVQVQAQQSPMAPQAPGQPPGSPMGHNGGPPMNLPPEVQRVLEAPSWEDVQALLRDNASRQFRVDIETDSTIEADEQGEKKQTVELLTALSSFIQQWGPAVKAEPALAPLAAELLKFSIRRFRAGRALEDVIESTTSQLMAQPPQQAQPEASKGPTPEQLQLEAAKIAQKDREAQSKQQLEGAKLQLVAKQTDAEILARAQEIEIERGNQQIKLIGLQADPNPQSTT